MKLLALINILLLTPSSADCQEKILIRRGERNKNEIKHVPLGGECSHECDCAAVPGKNVCCEKRVFGAKKCYECCKQKGHTCNVDKDCCSQKCNKGKCVRPIGPKPASQIGLCDILFPFDKLSPGDAPLIPNPAQPEIYVMPSRTGPLREIIFCPVHPKGGPEDLVWYELRGACAGDTAWTDIQMGSLLPHKDRECFNIPVSYADQLIAPHSATVDYLMYHLVFYLENKGKRYPRKLIAGPQPGGELRMLAKCNQAMDWGKAVNFKHGVHPQ